MAVRRCVDVTDGDRRTNTARNAVQKGAEVPNVSVVHYQQFGVGVDGSIAIEVNFFSCLWLVERHDG